jgi:hypothetical protein
MLLARWFKLREAAAAQVHGEGFLYRQVRHMVGALLAVGSGRMGPDRIASALAVGGSQLPGRGGVARGWDVAPAQVYTVLVTWQTQHVAAATAAQHRFSLPTVHVMYA